MEKEKKPLSPKQKAFCEEYITDFNGSAACVRVGYSAKASKEQASLLLTKTNINKYIAELLEKRTIKTELSAQWVLDELGKIAKDDNDKTLPQKIKALELIGKHFSMFTEKIEHSGKMTVNRTININPSKL